jgi:hypothetical protein
MIAAMIHRKWAREYLARAQYAKSRGRQCWYLQLAVNNTVRARMLETRADRDDDLRADEGPAA